MVEDTIEVNPVYKLNSLMANLSIGNNLIDRIKVAQANEEVLQEFLTSLEQVENGEGVIKFEGHLYVSFNEVLKNEVLNECIT